jgi:hypothetical protein
MRVYGVSGGKLVNFQAFFLLKPAYSAAFTALLVSLQGTNFGNSRKFP